MQLPSSNWQMKKQHHQSRPAKGDHFLRSTSLEKQVTGTTSYEWFSENE
ncbi:MAG: hypothetical protein ACXVBH_02430 [Flavisolibacter sp.]